MRSWEAELQSNVKELRTEDLKKLCDDEVILSGLRETLPQATESFHRQQAQARRNIDRAESIKKIIDEINALHANVTELQMSEDEHRTAWHSAERDMYSATEPYSYVGISKRLERDISDSAAITANVEKKIVDPGLKAEEAFILAKRFLDAQQQRYVKQGMLHSMK